MSSTDHPSARFSPPAPQRNLDRATQLGFRTLRHQADDQLRWLGAEPAQHLCRLAVLDGVLEVDAAANRVTTATGEAVGPHWRILVLHYLAIGGRPESREPTITFADLPTARSYNRVYEGRTVGRLCATAGRDESGLRAAAAALGGRPADGGDAAFDFQVFPRLVMRLVWHAPDDEFSPSATILLPENIESYFCAEDTVVLSERLVSRLCGRPF